MNIKRSSRDPAAGPSPQDTGHGCSLRADWRFGAGLPLAAGIIYILHLSRTLSASEAYTAMAASQPTYAAVIGNVLRFDPGKPPLYQIVLHSMVALFGNSETVLRIPSLIFSMVTVALVLVLGSELFGTAAGTAAAVLWALSPVSILYGAWARMYAMVIAMGLGQFLLLWKLRSSASAAKVIACGLLGGALLYTHLGGALFLGAEAMVLAGAGWRDERTRAAWIALSLTAIVFLPFLPTAARQTHELIAGHWVDWIGPAHPTNPVRIALTFLCAALAGAILSFGPRVEADDREPLRWCAAIGLLPIITLAAASIAIRPMFMVRYVAPSWAILTLLIVGLLALPSGRLLSRVTVAIATFFVCLFPYYPWHEPWRDIARTVSQGSPREPVFFESGYVASSAAQNDPARGFPQGFLRVPFDRYFSGPNPRLAFDPSAPEAARRAIAAAASAGGGAWLITGFPDGKARTELPTESFKIEKKEGGDFATLYHVVPINRAPT